MVDLLDRALVENPPVVIRDGGVIAEGYDSELDELRNISTNAGQFLVDLKPANASAPASAPLKSATTEYTATTLRSAVPNRNRRQRTISVVKP